ncbi:MAG: lytic murein transglycosylase [Nevskia sp.]|nr:lytic murein transglycosylase [Nevskia sp.]
MRIRRYGWRHSVLAVTALCGAALAHADYSGNTRAPQLYASLRQSYGFSEIELATVKTDLEQAQTLPQLISAEQNNKEKALSWDDYVRIHVTPANVVAGQHFMRDQHAWLARAELVYGVAPAVITALLGVETKYGAFTGRVRVLDALATQGFDHPTRSSFFFDELTQFFVLCRDQALDATQPHGSYAGAMGAAQFMPSNYRRLAIDFDGDGRRDLWSAADAIGSIANYLARYDAARAYRRGQPLLVPATVQGSAAANFERNTKYPAYKLAQLRAAGIRSQIELPGDLPAGLIQLDRTDGPQYWLALPNFYSVMSYNPRVFYAMSVAQLAQALTQPEAGE